MFFIRSLRFIGINCERGSNSVKNLFSKRPCTTQMSLKEKNTLKTFMKKPKTKSFKISAEGYILLIIPVTAFGLGTWQIQRKILKNKMIEDLEKRTSLEPENIPMDLNLLSEMEYCPVRVKGKFDHSKEIFIGPRPRIVDHKGHAQESTLLSSQKGGFLVITPFKLSDRDLTILVNRGWIPRERKSPKQRIEGQVSDEVEIVGLIRHTEKRKPLGMGNFPERGMWIHKDIEAISEITGSAPVLIDAVEESSEPGGPIGGQYVVKLLDDHINYMLTWYTLCGVTSYFWYKRYIKRI